MLATLVTCIYVVKNLFLQAISFVLIGAAAYAKVVAVITTVKVMGGIIACGVFLLLVAIVGLIGAVKHHQVLLFFVSFATSYVPVFSYVMCS